MWSILTVKLSDYNWFFFEVDFMHDVLSLGISLHYWHLKKAFLPVIGLFGTVKRLLNLTNYYISLEHVARLKRNNSIILRVYFVILSLILDFIKIEVVTNENIIFSFQWVLAVLLLQLLIFFYSSCFNAVDHLSSHPILLSWIYFLSILL